jgi:hypothetical protein
MGLIDRRDTDLGVPFASHVLCRSFGAELARKGTVRHPMR